MRRLRPLLILHLLDIKLTSCLLDNESRGKHSLLLLGSSQMFLDIDYSFPMCNANVCVTLLTMRKSRLSPSRTPYYHAVAPLLLKLRIMSCIFGSRNKRINSDARRRWFNGTRTEERFTVTIENTSCSTLATLHGSIQLNIHVVMTKRREKK